jgi:hypothetical protein
MVAMTCLSPAIGRGAALSRLGDLGPSRPKSCRLGEL